MAQSGQFSGEVPCVMPKRPTTYILVNPGHGYEPSRLGIQLGLGLLPLVRADALLVPAVFTGLRSLVNDDFPQDASRIKISLRLGAIYRDALLDISSYRRHLQLIIDSRDSLERQVRSEVERFEKRNRASIALEVITGSRIVATEGRPIIFAFQGLLSTILRKASSHRQFAADRDRMSRVADLMARVEERYSACFIPHDSPFLDPDLLIHLHQPPVDTPPLRRFTRTPKRFSIARPSTFLMISGTGRGAQAPRVAAAIGLPYVANRLARRGSGFAPLEVFGPNVLAVVTRGGSGTHWLCRHAVKPQVFLPFEPDDDPEIYFNTLHYSHIGVGVRYSRAPIPLSALHRCRQHIAELNAKVLPTYHTLDGIRYILKLVPRLRVL